MSKYHVVVMELDASDTLVNYLLLWPHVLGNKLTQDNVDSGVQFITPGGPRQSHLLAKDPNQFFVKTLFTLSVCVQIYSPNSLSLV